jgi:octaprenyl-diphosphate synthase
VTCVTKKSSLPKHACQISQRDLIRSGAEPHLFATRGEPRAPYDRARHYGAIARDALGLFDDHPAKQTLLDVVDFTGERGF